VIRSALACAVVVGTAAPAQEGPTPTPEHKFIQQSAGTWDATITLPGAPPMKGTLEIKKLGGLWTTSTLKADFGPIKYEGRGTSGYDPRKKKFVGSWADNISDSLAVLEGAVDLKTETTTTTWSQALPDGTTAHFKLVTARDGDDKMKGVYHRGATPDDLKEIMTIEYVRAKSIEAKKE
jgi:hypothetical protein